MTEITINKTCAIVDRCEQITSGRVGARIKFSFSSEWAGLNKTAVFTNGDTTIDVLNVADEIVIPHEVLAISGKKLKVGVYGFTADDNGNIEIAIPTVYAELGKVVKGADPSGDESTDPSLPVWAQIQSDVSDLDDRVTELKEDLALKADKDEIPTALPNPHKLTINGTEYDGSSDVQMTIQGGDGGIPDAPADGKQYARQNNEWTPTVQTSAEIEEMLAVDVGLIYGGFSKEDVIDALYNGKEAPNTYAKKTDIPQNVSAFTNDSGYLTEAPFDGKQYARKDGAWSEVQGGGGSALVIKEADVTSTTFAEITAAYNSGRMVLFEDDHAIMMLTHLTTTMAQFQGLTGSDGGNNRMFMSYANVTSTGQVATAAFWMPTTLYVDNKITTAISNAIGGAY